MKSHETVERLGGWGLLTGEDCHVTRPETLDQLREAVVRGPQSAYISRGFGRSYGDPAINKNHGVIDHTRLNRMLAFDPGTGVIEAEAGVELGEVVTHLRPRGWTLAVTPGTRFVTLGGAIAADVHGKNHHVDGSFANFVDRFSLLTANGETVNCSRTENSDVFWATVGGMGLTGVILSAVIRLKRVETSFCKVITVRRANLDSCLEHFAEVANHHRYSVAWVDCLARGKRLGRSVIMTGDDAVVDDLPPKLRNRPLATAKKRQLRVPFFAPEIVLNPLSVAALNATYWSTQQDGQQVVDMDSYFYPLDSVLDWNRVYGRRGFIQYQALLPPETSRQGLIELLEAISNARAASFLAVLKTTGPASGAPLSFLRPGHTLALDLPNTGSRLRRLTQKLDDILLRLGGRLYLAKDAITTAEAFQAMYPELAGFRLIKDRLDPNRRFLSSQARRLGIVEAT